MKKTLFIPFLIVCFTIANGQDLIIAYDRQENPLSIEFNSKAFIRINFENVLSSFQLQFDYYPHLHLTRLKTGEFEINKDTTILISLTTHMPQKHNFKVLDLKLPVFIVQNDTVQINIDLKHDEIRYSGANANINAYYLTVNEHYQNNFKKYAQLHGNELDPWEQIFEEMDSIAAVELDLLKSTKIPIPEWFKDLEKQRIIFHAADLKLSGPTYRNFLNKNSVEIPNANNFQFLNTLNLNSPYNKYLSEFYSFMNFYSSFKIFGKYYALRDSSIQLFYDGNFANKKFQIFEGIINDDNLLAFEIDNTLDDISRNSVRKEKRINYLTEKYDKEHKFIKYLLKTEDTYGQKKLSKGDRVPYFYLANGNNNNFSISDFKGKLVLLNFFIRGCKPCFKEVPYEKELLIKYKDRNFEILNICITNNEQDFHKAVEQYEMDGITLYTPGNWKDKIKSEYNIVGFPQYCLIDSQGYVIMNHAFKPSQPELEKLILQNLPE